jgi:hypothetical protein
MSRPYFSVVIPTKNRSFLVGHAIRSVLQQTHEDLELIIADNDDDADATRMIVAGFDDRRIKYHRSGGLSMCDNWDFGYEKAVGEYIMILEDRMALKLDALEKVHGVLYHDAHSVVVWGVDFLNQVLSMQVIARYHGHGRPTIVKADDILRTFLSVSRMQWCHILPLGYNSFVHRSVYEAIRSGKLGRVFAPIAPDYTSAFQVINSVDEVLHMGQALAVTGGSRHSAGGHFMLKRPERVQIMKDIGGGGCSYSELPIKVATISGSVYNDYLKASAALGGRLSTFSLSMPHYFVQCWEEIAFGRSRGVNMDEEERAWKEALSRQSEDIRYATKNALAKDRFGRFMRCLRLPQMWNTVRQFPMRAVFDDVMDYVNSENSGHSN